eukprot:s2183_g8.t1
MIYGAIAAHEAEVKTGLEEARRQTRKDNRPKEFMVPIKRFEMAQGLACHFAQGEAPENLHDVVEEARIHHDRHGCLPPGVRRPPVGEGDLSHVPGKINVLADWLSRPETQGQGGPSMGLDKSTQTGLCDVPSPDPGYEHPARKAHGRIEATSGNQTLDKPRSHAGPSWGRCARTARGGAPSEETSSVKPNHGAKFAKALDIARNEDSLAQAVSELKDKFFSDSNKAPQARKEADVLELITTLAKRGPAFPLVPQRVHEFGAVLKSASYKSGSNTSEHCGWPTWRETIRDKAKADRAPEFQMNDFPGDAHSYDLRPGEVAFPVFTYCVALAFILRRCELERTRWEDLTLDPKGRHLTLHIKKSKTDQEGKGVKRTLGCTCRTSKATCPVELYKNFARAFDKAFPGRDRAKAWLTAGLSIAQVTYLGRWHSDLVFQYGEEAGEGRPMNHGSQTEDHHFTLLIEPPTGVPKCLNCRLNWDPCGKPGFNDVFASAWGLAQDGLGMTSAEKFDTNIYGFAWFEATPCRDHVCEGASLQEPCHAVEDFSGVRNPKNLSTWRLRRFSAADNPGSGNGVGAEDVQDQHSFGLAKLLYYLREFGRGGGIAACSTTSTEKVAIAHTLDTGTNFTDQSCAERDDVCTPICEFWSKIYGTTYWHGLQSMLPKMQAVMRAARDIMADLLASHAQRVIELLPGKEVSSQLWQGQIMVRNAIYAEKLSRVYALERQLRTGRKDLKQCAELRHSITESLAYGIETYWTQGAFDAVVGRLQLSLSKPCVTGTACDLDISTAGFLDAFVENLADLFKELSHTKEEFQLIDRKLSRFYPDQTSKEHAVQSGELYGYCKSREVCEAVTRGQCGDWQKCSLCLAWPVRANSSDMDCVPASSVPFYHFLIEGAKYMHRAWTMVQFSRSKPHSGRNVWQDEMAATTEYMAACTAAYADQFQADWRGTGQQVPLEVLRAALVCWPQTDQEIPALADHMQVLGAYWILYMLSDSLGFMSLCDRLTEGPREQVFEVLERQPTYCGSLDEITEQDDLVVVN